METQVTDKSELVTVYTLNDPYKAGIIKNALRAEGILCELDGPGQAGLFRMLSIGVLVRATDADLARDYIEKHERDEESVDASI